MADRQRLPRRRRGSPPGARRGPGSRTEWIGTPSPIRAAVAFAVPDGASSFVSAWSSTISARGKHAGGLLGEAHHQHRAEREVRRVEARDARLAGAAVDARRVSKPVVPTTSGTRASRRGAALPSTASGRVKSTATSHPLGPSARPSTTSCPASLERRAEHRPDLAGRAEEADPHDRSASAGLMRATRGAEPALARPDARRGEPLRRVELARGRRDVGLGDRLGRAGSSPRARRARSP